jgi:S1-C subfamily serine protease
LKESSGVLVYGVTQDGPAARGEIEPGDVLTSPAGKSLESVEDVYARSGDTSPVRQFRSSSSVLAGRTRHAHAVEQCPATELEA